jgi:hypothetical protein
LVASFGTQNAFWITRGLYGKKGAYQLTFSHHCGHGAVRKAYIAELYKGSQAFQAAFGDPQDKTPA